MSRTGLGELEEFALDHVRGTVRGGVVDNQDFGGFAGRKASALGQERLEALAEQVAGVERDNDDGGCAGIGRK